MPLPFLSDNFIDLAIDIFRTLILSYFPIRSFQICFYINHTQHHNQESYSSSCLCNFLFSRYLHTHFYKNNYVVKYLHFFFWESILCYHIVNKFFLFLLQKHPYHQIDPNSIYFLLRFLPYTPNVATLPLNPHFLNFVWNIGISDGLKSFKYHTASTGNFLHISFIYIKSTSAKENPME